MADNWHQEDGFEFALFRAKTEKPQSLVVILHGFGGNGSGWNDAAAQIQEKIPGADVIALQAPLKFSHPDLPNGGYMWFNYNGGHFLKQGKLWLSHIFSHIPVIDKINAFTDAQLKKRGLTQENLGLVGQSMGAIVALQAGVYGKKPCGAVVSHAGAFLPFTKVRSKPELMLIVGENDDIFNAPPPQKGLKRIFAAAARAVSFSHTETMRRLDRKKIPYTAQVFPGMQHEITPQSWEAGNEFLAKRLKPGG